MVKDIGTAEKMSIWKICEILDYLALERDLNEKEMKKINKKK